MHGRFPTRGPAARLAPLALVPACVALAACAAAGGGSRTALAGTVSGISGRTLIGPTCPVQRPGQSCVAPYRATLRVLAPHRRLVATVRSGSDGRFRVRLAPGRYLVEPLSRGFPHARNRAVAVRRGAFTRVTIMYDSGLR